MQKTIAQSYRARGHFLDPGFIGKTHGLEVLSEGRPVYIQMTKWTWKALTGLPQLWGRTTWT